MDTFKGFGSDNQSGVHPAVMEALKEANVGHVHAYADDPYTEAANTQFKKVFGKDIASFYVFNGTGANIVSLGCALSKTDCIIGSSQSHIFNDESNAPFLFTSAKYITIDGDNGKVSVDGIEQYLNKYRNDEHRANPSVISITQPTELGVLYTKEEIAEIAQLAHRHHMFLHMDGARIFVAAAAMGLPFRAFTGDCGVDILSFGGTKNGMMFGEAVIFFNKKLQAQSKRMVKLGTQLASKNRFIAAQFSALLKNNNGIKWAKHAVETAKLLGERLEEILGIKPCYPSDTNAVFIKIPQPFIKPLQDKFHFYVWDEEQSIVRLMCSFDSQKNEVEGFVNILKEELGK